MTREEIENRVLYRDGLMLIINKPAGIPVHKGRGGGENLEQYFEHLRYGLPRDPALAHRLDRDTSGCLVLGRHRKALQKLGKLFEQGKVEKTYWAVVAGIPPAAEGRIDMPLRKASQASHEWKMEAGEGTGSQPALTSYALIGAAEIEGTMLSWLELKPHTGRTHQLRVHCAASGFPILGDAMYGNRELNAKLALPLQLHARAITVPLYPKKEPIPAVAEPPEKMAALLALLKQD